MTSPRLLPLPLLLAWALAACNGDVTTGPATPDAAADVTIVTDAAPDGEPSPLPTDASPDAIADATLDAAPSDADATPDATTTDATADDAGLGSDADGAPGPDAAPVYGTQVTSPLPGGAIPFWLGGGGAGPLVLGGAVATSTPFFVTLNAIDPADAGVTQLADFLEDSLAGFLYATNGNVVVYSDPASRNLLVVPVDGSGPSELLPSTAYYGGCDAIGLDGAHVYCASYGGKGVFLANAPLVAADAGSFGQLAYVVEAAKPSRVVVSGATVDVVEQLDLPDGGAEYAVEAYPSGGLPDGGVPTTVGAGPGTVLQVASGGSSICYTILTGPSGAESYGVACASTSIAGQETTVAAPSTTQLGGIAIDPPALWFASERAIERTTITGGTVTQVTLAFESAPPTLALDAAHVYWADPQGEIWTTQR